MHNTLAYERILESSISVWLKAQPEDYMQRVLAQGDHRPIADRNDAMSELHNLVQSRTPQYERADLQINTSGQSAGEVSQYIFNNLEAYCADTLAAPQI